MTNQIAQTVNLPDQNSTAPITGLLPPGSPFTNLGSLVTQALNLAFIIAVFLAFFWLVWGAFQYIFAGGDKQALASARKRLTWAIVGLIILSLAFAIAQYAEQILMPRNPSPISFELVTPVFAQAPPTRPWTNIGDIYDFGRVNSLGEGVNLLVGPTFAIATTGVVFYIIIGAVRFLTSAGNKEAVSSARAMITHAIIGFLILMFIFLVLQFIPEFFGINFKIIGP